MIKLVEVQLCNLTSPFLITEGLSGEKLQEGDTPKTYPVKQESLEIYAAH